MIQVDIKPPDHFYHSVLPPALPAQRGSQALPFLQRTRDSIKLLKDGECTEIWEQTFLQYPFNEPESDKDFLPGKKTDSNRNLTGVLNYRAT